MKFFLLLFLLFGCGGLQPSKEIIYKEKPAQDPVDPIIKDPGTGCFVDKNDDDDDDKGGGYGGGNQGGGNQGGGCIPSGVSFQKDVLPVLNKSCNGANCHSSPGASGIALDNLNGAKKAFNASISAINSGRMPLGRSISQADIATFKSWSPAFNP